MKKLIYFVIAVFLLSAVPQISFAQSDDPFEQETLKTNNNGNTRREKKINRKKQNETEETTTVVPKQPVVKPEPKKIVVEPVKTDEMIISNPCSDWLDFEFISLVGSRGSQQIKFTCRITNHDVNKNIRIGSNLIAYDNEGNEHSSSYRAANNYDCITGVPVKVSFDIPEKANPAVISKLPVISFNIDNCRIEMRNVPIDWK